MITSTRWPAHPARNIAYTLATPGRQLCRTHRHRTALNRGTSPHGAWLHRYAQSHRRSRSTA